MRLLYGRFRLVYLVCFDIVEDRARYHVAKILKGYGCRVQKSVFECANITEEQFLKMKNRLEDCINATEDSIRYYRLCKGCLRAMEYAGVGDPPVAERYHVV